MGARAQHPTSPRRRKRLSNKKAAEAELPRGKRVSKAGRVSRAKGHDASHPQRRLYPESVPPAMVAEVFDVPGTDDDLVSVLTPPPPPPRDSAAPRAPSLPDLPRGADLRLRPLSKPPAPHPPRPSARPSAAPADTTEEQLLDEAALELDPDGALASELVAPPLTPLPTEVQRPSPVPSRRGLWWATALGALCLGVVIGMHLQPSERGTSAPARGPSRAALERPAARPPSSPALPSSEPSPSLDLDALDESVAEGAATPSEGDAPRANSSEAAASSARESSVQSGSPEPARVAEPASHGRVTAPFDAEAASAAITAAFRRAATCRKPTDPVGETVATLTYAPSGRVTTATVGGVFAGTPTGGCIASALRGARVPPFAGEYLTVRRSVRLE